MFMFTTSPLVVGSSNWLDEFWIILLRFLLIGEGSKDGMNEMDHRGSNEASFSPLRPDADDEMKK